MSHRTRPSLSLPYVLEQPSCSNRTVTPFLAEQADTHCPLSLQNQTNLSMDMTEPESEILVLSHARYYLRMVAHMPTQVSSVRIWERPRIHKHIYISHLTPLKRSPEYLYLGLLEISQVYALLSELVVHVFKAKAEDVHTFRHLWLTSTLNSLTVYRLVRDVGL